MSMMKSALFSLALLSLPAAASAQSSGGLGCLLFPSQCAQAPQPTAVPELDANAFGAAGVLVVGAALLIGSRRRQRWS